MVISDSWFARVDQGIMLRSPPGGKTYTVFDEEFEFQVKRSGQRSKPVSFVLSYMFLVAGLPCIYGAQKLTGILSYFLVLFL